jgi:hypothetical protein
MLGPGECRKSTAMVAASSMSPTARRLSPFARADLDSTVMTSINRTLARRSGALSKIADSGSDGRASPQCAPCLQLGDGRRPSREDRVALVSARPLVPRLLDVSMVAGQRPGQRQRAGVVRERRTLAHAAVRDRTVEVALRTRMLRPGRPRLHLPPAAIRDVLHDAAGAGQHQQRCRQEPEQEGGCASCHRCRSAF